MYFSKSYTIVKTYRVELDNRCGIGIYPYFKYYTESYTMDKVQRKKIISINEMLYPFSVSPNSNYLASPSYFLTFHS
jgi:hypothetical protein